MIKRYIQIYGYANRRGIVDWLGNELLEDPMTSQDPDDLRW